MTICPRCREPAASGQDYCLECGARLTGGWAAGARDPGSTWTVRALVAAVVALAGTALAVAATNDGGGGVELTTAMGGFTTAPASSTLPGPSEGGASVAEWPAGVDGWTIVLASVPQTRGRREADARAERARARGLTQVGVLDSSRYASLHPGYWIVFSGVYGSEAEATSALEPARRVSRTAAVRHVVA
jgi:hypothetical protein